MTGEGPIRLCCSNIGPPSKPLLIYWVGWHKRMYKPLQATMKRKWKKYSSISYTIQDKIYWSLIKPPTLNKLDKVQHIWQRELDGSNFSQSDVNRIASTSVLVTIIVCILWIFFFLAGSLAIAHRQLSVKHAGALDTPASHPARTQRQVEVLRSQCAFTGRLWGAQAIQAHMCASDAASQGTNFYY